MVNFMSEQKPTWEQELFERQTGSDHAKQEAERLSQEAVYKQVMGVFKSEKTRLTPTEQEKIRQIISEIIVAEKDLLTDPDLGPYARHDFCMNYWQETIFRFFLVNGIDLYHEVNGRMELRTIDQLMALFRTGGK